MNKGGAPSKLDPKRKKDLFAALQRGATYEIACDLAGISYKTLRNWIKRGEKQKTGEFFQFLQELKKTQATAVVNLLDIIDKAAVKNWQAAAWKLERRYPETYGRTIHEHTGKDGKPIAINSTSPKERLLAKLAGIAAAAGTKSPTSETE